MRAIFPVLEANDIIALSFDLPVLRLHRGRCTSDEIQDDRAVTELSDIGHTKLNVPAIARRCSKRLVVPVFVSWYAESNVARAVLLGPE